MNLNSRGSIVRALTTRNRYPEMIGFFSLLCGAYAQGDLLQEKQKCACNVSQVHFNLSVLRTAQNTAFSVSFTSVPSADSVFRHYF
jgi:hypothetical protein